MAMGSPSSSSRRAAGACDGRSASSPSEGAMLMVTSSIQISRAQVPRLRQSFQIEAVEHSVGRQNDAGPGGYPLADRRDQ